MFDPLVSRRIPSLHSRPDSFWAENQPVSSFPRLEQDIDTDVVIVGGGYTGLSCALTLATRYGINCTLLEANQPGWGCSGRNGGFVLPGTGRLGIDAIQKRWGTSVSQEVYAEYLRSIATVKGHIDAGIECDMTQGGYLKLAHQAHLVTPLQQQAKQLESDYGDSVRLVDKHEIAEQLLSGSPAHGGIYYPNAFGINPWLFAQGLANKSARAGATLFGNSPVLTHRHENNQHVLVCAAGTVRAKKMIIATNGYTPKGLFKLTNNRTFPVLSSVIVTQPLTAHQLAAIGVKPGLMVMDTRALKYYYRLLPDNRLLFGGRGAVKGKDANNSDYQQALTAGLQATFPHLSGIEVAHFWSGWVSVSLDDYPRIYHQQSSSTLYSAGYCGAGLAFSVQAGQRLAQLLYEPNSLPNLPYWQSPLRKFPLPQLRRPALSLFYAWQALKNRFSASA